MWGCELMMDTEPSMRTWLVLQRHTEGPDYGARGRTPFLAECPIHRMHRISQARTGGLPSGAASGLPRHRPNIPNVFEVYVDWQCALGYGRTCSSCRTEVQRWYHGIEGPRLLNEFAVHGNIVRYLGPPQETRRGLQRQRETQVDTNVDMPREGGGKDTNRGQPKARNTPTRLRNLMLFSRIFHLLVF